MRCHLGVGAVDLGIVETGLDDGGFGIVRHQQMRNTANRLQGADMGIDPVRKRLGPARMREREARRAQHRDKDLRIPDFAGQPVDHDRHAITRIINEQPFAGGVGLPHRRRQLRFKAAIKFAKPRIAVTARVRGDIFIPDNQQRDVLALQFPVDRGPIRLSVAAMSPFAPAVGVKRRLQVGIAHSFRQRPDKAGTFQPNQRLPNRRRREPETPRDLACRDTSAKLQTNDLARLAHRNSLRWHRSLLGIAKGAILNRPAVELVAVPDPGRDHPVPVGGIIS
jgi:hypothetical protein